MRVFLILKLLRKYVTDIESLKGLGFCVSKEHAEYMSRKFNEAGIASECPTRELRKELCIDIKPLREYCRSVFGELSFVFIEAEIVSGEPQLSVHKEMRWVLPEELTAFEWCPADKAVAEEISKENEHISL